MDIQRREIPTETALTFSGKDRFGVKYPHDDALVINIEVGGFEVRPVLVDNESSFNIIFVNTFQKIKIPDEILTSSNTIVLGFAGEASTPKEKIEFPVIVGDDSSRKTITTSFFVVKARQPFNTIMGRTWLHDMEALASSYHQCLKYPTANRTEIIKDNQVVARQCLTSALRDANTR